MNTKKIGEWGEKIAKDYLRQRGYKIIDSNYRFQIPGSPQQGEIDIVAQDNSRWFDFLKRKGRSLHFVEVKTLRLKGDWDKELVFLPEEKVNRSKRHKIAKAAEAWLIQKNIPLDSRWQIDILAVTTDSYYKKTKIKYFQNIQIK